MTELQIKAEWEKAQSEHFWDETNQPLVIIAKRLWEECRKIKLHSPLVQELFEFSKYDTFAWN